jgi:hypothetical protein
MLDPVTRMHLLECLALSPLFAFLPLVLVTILAPLRR